MNAATSASSGTLCVIFLTLNLSEQAVNIINLNTFMKLIVFLLSITAFFTSCKSQTDRFQPLADNIKRSFSANIPNINNIDTLYVLVDSITPRDKCVLQSAEYRWASTEAKRSGNADSSLLENKSESVILLANNFDSTNYLYYRARALAIYTKNDAQKGMAEEWFFFDKDFKQIPKYSFIEKAAKVDALGLSVEDYVPLSFQDQMNFKAIGMREYHYNQ